MQQVAHIFSRIERSKIYQFGSFSLRAFCKSELNFASSFASKLRKFGRKKSELIAAIFPSRRRKFNWKSRKVLRDLANKYCTNIASISVQHSYDFCFNIITMLKQNMWQLTSILESRSSHYPCKIDAFFKRHFDALTVQNMQQYYSYSRQKLAQFWPGFDANNGINFYQATA